MTIAAGKKPSAADLVLPAVVTGYGNGSNTITATSWTVLPTNTCTAAITNPHPTAAMRILCTYGGWLSASANDVRMMPAVSGSVTIAAGVGTSAAGWGEVPMADSAAGYAQIQGSFTYDLPVSGTAATFSMQAYRSSGSGTQVVAYPVIRLIPICYVF